MGKIMQIVGEDIDVVELHCSEGGKPFHPIFTADGDDPLAQEKIAQTKAERSSRAAHNGYEVQFVVKTRKALRESMQEVEEALPPKKGDQ